MTRMTLFSCVFIVGMLLGGLVDVAVGPVLSFASSYEPLSEVAARKPPTQKMPALRGVETSPSASVEAPVPPRPQPHLAPTAAHPPSPFPSHILDLYAELNPVGYSKIFAPVRVYSTVEDLAEAFGKNAALLSQDSVVLAAAAAARRRGGALLPANRYLLAGIPTGGGTHEALIGVLRTPDLATAEQMLGSLAKAAGLDESTFARGTPGHGAALAIAESYLQARIQHRLREQAVLARMIQGPTRTAGDDLRGRVFLVLPRKPGLYVIPRGADLELDALVDAYIEAPRNTRDRIKAKEPR